MSKRVALGAGRVLAMMLILVFGLMLVGGLVKTAGSQL